jgi:hypothetical protein
MALTQLGIIILGAAVLAALVLGAMASSVLGALIRALVVWVLFLAVWYMWGPPLPYGDWPSLSFAAIGCGVGLGVAAIVAHWLRGLMGGSRATS